MNLIARYLVFVQSTLSEELYSKERVEREYFQSKTGQRSDKYRRNLAKLVVHYQAFNYEHIKEIEAYPVSNLQKTSFDCQTFHKFVFKDCLVGCSINGWALVEKVQHWSTLDT